MSTELAKGLIQRWYEEMFNRGDLAVADELFAPDYLNHGAAPPGTPAGPGAAQRVVALYRAALPDLRVTIEDQVAEGDRVATRWACRGTQRGELLGVPPTGQAVAFTGIALDRIAGGKIAETWVEIDLLGLLQQLGVVPAPGTPGGRR